MRTSFFLSDLKFKFLFLLNILNLERRRGGSA